MSKLFVRLNQNGERIMKSVNVKAILTDTSNNRSITELFISLSEKYAEEKNMEVQTKKCKGCGEVKEITKFQKDDRTKEDGDGLCDYCKICCFYEYYEYAPPKHKKQRSEKDKVEYKKKYNKEYYKNKKIEKTEE